MVSEGERKRERRVCDGTVRCVVAMAMIATVMVMEMVMVMAATLPSVALGGVCREYPHRHIDLVV